MADRKGGFPHSEITGSKGARASPVLIAACHVLHRLSMPRHPLEALIRLIVLSKTHARAISTGTQARHDLSNEAHISFGICQIMMSSQVQPGQHGLRVRLNPSFTMSKHSRRKPMCNYVTLSRESPSQWMVEPDGIEPTT